eukprot:TRINITY_DN9417_c0_g1_i1.p1 TRINITY_DN9417_c0_g1~~TRINITY_DN9417_c0_g1_i1.p1  ORF type:complete len:390 (-),score=99.86 TRINITY_DN9417_c0_g1_i1:201-1370(-)
MESSEVFTGQPSSRSTDTVESAIGSIIHLLRPGVTNLSQGMVYWTPPAEAVESAKIAASATRTHRYGPIQGAPELLSALQEKITRENKLTNRRIMVTAGANQAFMNVVLTVCDAGDEAVLFAPYYFNHLMALQLTNVTPVVIESTRTDSFDIGLDALRANLTPRTKLVILVSPGNPTGAVQPESVVRELQKLCLERGIWLYSDEAYENFTFDDARPHFSPDGPNVINAYSFSKAYSMAGWRVGYIAYPPALESGLAKAQDTIPINASQVSQQLAVSCLQRGSAWVREQVQTLERNREAIWDAVSVMPGTIKTTGAFFFMIRLPEGVDDLKAAEFLATEFKVLLIPCSSCGVSGYLRVSYGNLPPDECVEAARRLKAGLLALRERSSNLA